MTQSQCEKAKCYSRMLISLMTFLYCMYMYTTCPQQHLLFLGESITGDHGVVKVTCIFARGSMAQGCLIVIVPVGNQSSTVHSEIALRQESNGVLSQNTSHSYNLSVGTYSIVIFDVEADGHVNLMRWLYNERININATCVSPSTTASLPAPSMLEPGLYVCIYQPKILLQHQRL